MAAEAPMQELCEEASCSICLEFFRDPVMIAECGHNFCRACLTRSWGESAAQPSCPQCRGPAQEGSLRQNQQLANFVDILKKCSPLEAKGAEAKGGEGEREGVCEEHGEPLSFFCQEDEAPLCVVCRRSQKHRGHQVTPLKEAAPEKETVVVARKERVCLKHQERLKLFCIDHVAPICVICDQSQEHKDHNIIPVEEASQAYKDLFCTYVEDLQKERNKILAYRANIVKESQDLLKHTKREQRMTVAKFRQLHTFLDKQEKLLLAQMDEVEKEVVRRKDWHLAELSEELSYLENLIREVEEKCQQSASDLVQDASNILQRYEEKDPFENPVAFPLALKWRTREFSDFSPLLEGIKKQLKDTLNSGLHQQKASMTLDPDTAHPQLILSEGQKKVNIGEKAQALPTNPERFDKWTIVLGCEGFTGGCHYWEVLVGSEENWAVGVARKSVRRKQEVVFDTEAGIWALGRWSKQFRSTAQGLPFLSLTGKLKRIRVCLNYDGGRVAFFDADQAVLLYELFEGSFSGEVLLPLFWVASKGHLKITS